MDVLGRRGRLVPWRHFLQADACDVAGEVPRSRVEFADFHPPPYDAFMARPSGWLDRNRELAPFLLRMFVALVLVYGTYDNVASEARMLEFRDFLAANGFPMPLEMAYLSAYGQFVAGFLLIAGFLTRAAAVIVIVNFLVALVMVHLRLPWNANVAPLAMLTGGVFFLLYGAPRYSVDALLAARR